MLEQNIKDQVKQYLQLLEKEVVFTLSLDNSEDSLELNKFVEEIAGLSEKIHIKKDKLKYTPSFSISSD